MSTSILALSPLGSSGPRRFEAAWPRRAAKPLAAPRLAAPSAPELATRAVRGTVVSLVGTLGGQVVRLASNLVVTWLLSPEAYGLMALVITLDIGLTMLSDLGTRISIIHNQRGDERAFLDTAFTVELVRGAALAGVALLLAWPFAWLYGDERLVAIVMVYACSALLNGAMSTKLASLQRHMLLGWQVTMDLTALIAGSGFTVAYAYFVDPSVWALVYGSLVNTVVRLAMSHLALPGARDRLRWDPTAARAIFSFGGWIFVSTMITFFAQRVDILLIGVLFPLEATGVYNIANVLASVPMLLGGRVIGSVLLPALAHAGRSDRAALARAYDRGMHAIMLAGGVVCLGVALVAPAFFHFLYDARYHEAGWIAQYLMLAVWFGYLQESAGRALTAVGDARSLVMANAVKLLVTTAGCWVGYCVGALPGFMLGAAVGAAAGQAVIVVRLRTLGLDAGRADVRSSAVGIALGVVGVGLPYVLAPWLGVHPAWLALAAAGLIGGPAVLYAGRTLLRKARP